MSAMHKVLPCAAAAGLALMASAAQGSLLYHYTFDNAADLTVNSGSGAVAVSGGTMDAVAAGRFGAAARSGADGGYWVTETTNGLGLSFDTGFSVSLHVSKPADLADLTSWDDYFSIGDNDLANRIKLENTGADQLAIFTNSSAVGGTTDTDPRINGAGPVLNDGAWHQIGLTYDPATGVMTGYVDGAPIDSYTFTAKPTGPIDGIQLASELTQGVRAIDTLLDDVAVYDVALCEAQMNWLAGNVAVDSVPVPEPTSVALAGLVGGGLLLRSRRRA